MADPTWDESIPIPSPADAPPVAPVQNVFAPTEEAPTWENSFNTSEKYGGLSGGAKAFGLGAARMASFGTFDQFLARSGMMKPEDIKGYAEENPFATGAGELGGVLGAVFAPEEGVLGALAAPTKIVGELGNAATKAVAPALSPYVGKIVSQHGAEFLGSAIEMSAYGLGSAVSEDALGDPQALGEKLLPNLGMSFLLGGGIGAALGIGGRAIPSVLKAAAASTNAVRDLAERAITRTASIVSGKSAEDIAPLIQGLGTKEGALMRKQALEGFAERETTARELTEGLATQHETMNTAVKEYYTGARQEEIDSLMENVPHDAVYQAAIESAEHIKSTIKEMRSEPELYSASGKIRQLELVFKALKQKLKESIPDFSKSAYKEFGHVVRDLEDKYPNGGPELEKELNAIVTKYTGETSAKGVYHALNDAKQQIADLSKFHAQPTDAERATVNRIKKLGYELRTNLENPKIWGEAGARQGALNSAYYDWAKSSGNFLKVFGKKLASGEVKIDPGKVNTFLGQMGRPGADLRQEILADYLEASHGLAKQMAESHKNSISKVDTGKLMDLFRKTQGIAEGAESELEAVNQMKRLKNQGAGPIGIAAGLGMGAHMIGGPHMVAGVESAYAVYHSLHNPAELVRVLSSIERAGMKVTAAINKGAEAIFKTTEKGSQPRSYLTEKYISREDRKKEHNKIQPQLYNLNSNPEQLIDKLQNITHEISEQAPQTMQGLQISMTNAVKFLGSKLPSNGISHQPLSSQYEPSDAELSKWYKYYSTVENPTDVLKQVAAGTIGMESMETMQTVYPEMLSEMQGVVMDKLTSHMGKDKVIPFRTKMALSLFLGHDMVNSLNPTSMLANQNMLATATQAKADQQAQIGSVNKKNIGKIGKGNRMLTDAQMSAQRNEG